MVSIFVPCEPLAAMGIIPYSLEGLSSYITGTNMHGGCLEECKKKGFPETLCSYHRVYIGAAERQLMPKPPFIIYSNLACDANQITFKYLAEKFSIPSFYIDVPYNQNHESVLYVALQLRKMVNFIETCTGQKMSEEAFAKAMKRSKNTIDNYKDYLYNQKTKYVKGDITSEMYMAVTNHILLGTKEQENLSKMCLENIDAAPNNKGLKLLWVHTIPFWQEPLRNLFNFNESEF
ncbi:2-hydroxyacyl-CoA dehydratase [Clostridium sediminicola]|uniref:2-hydroxyacyl-CoA dehydratase n=1 Tax=Clostridium sediminicola TaxID=3114879 RepID=UPI003D174226